MISELKEELAAAKERKGGKPCPCPCPWRPCPCPCLEGRFVPQGLQEASLALEGRQRGTSVGCKANLNLLLLMPLQDTPRQLQISPRACFDSRGLSSVGLSVGLPGRKCDLCEVLALGPSTNLDHTFHFCGPHTITLLGLFFLSFTIFAELVLLQMFNIFASLLLLLPLRLTSSNSSPVTLTPSQLQYLVKERIETYRHQQPVVTSHQTHEPGAVGSNTPSRQLQPSFIGRKLLIHAEYQLSTLEPKTAAYVQSIVESAIETIQSYLSLNTTTPPGPLLLSPIYYSPQDCDRTNYYSTLTGSTCLSPGYSPAFNETLARNDVRSPYCGPAALLNKSHFLDPKCLNGECQTSVTGGLGVQTDYYLYITADVTPGICSVGTSVSGTAAYALPCFLDGATFRPILGAFNICPLAFKTYTSSARLVSLVVHEMMHTLGFSNNLFFAFTGADGDASKVSGT